MNRSTKENLVCELVDIYLSSSWVFLINYTGMDAGSTVAFRSEIRCAGAGVVVVKNSINRIALEKCSFSGLKSSVCGQVAVVYGNDSVLLAKILKKYFGDKKISFIASSDGKNLYDTSVVDRLANLPSIGVLYAQLLGTILAPISGLLRTMKEPSSALVRVFDAKS